MPGAEELVSAGDAAFDAGRYDEAVARFDEAVARLADSADVGARGWLAYALTRKGYALTAAGRLEDSIGARDELIERLGGERDDAYVRDLVSRAFDRKARALYDLRRYEEQLDVRTAELARYTESVPIDCPLARVYALAGRADALAALGRHREALADWDELLARLGHATEPAARVEEAKALMSRAGELRALGEYDAALADLSQLQGRFAREEHRSITWALAESLLEQARIWKATAMPELAEFALEKLTSEFALETDGFIARTVTCGLFAGAENGYVRGEVDSADGLYAEALSRARQASDPRVWETAMRAAIARARALFELLGSGDALADLARRSAEIRSEAPNDAALVGQVLLATAYLTARAERYEDALSMIDQIIDGFSDSDRPSLQQTVVCALVERAKLLLQLGRTDEAEAVFEEQLLEHADAALAVFDDQINTPGPLSEPERSRQLASSMAMRASFLALLDRDDESAAALDEVIAMFAGENDPVISVVVEQARSLRADLDDE